MKSPYITQEVIDTVLCVNTLFRGKVVFCGSFGLVLNGKLDRPIHDIDCITDDCLYGSFFELIGKYGLGTSNSEKFVVDGVPVCVFKLTSPNGMGVDVMYRPHGCKEGKKIWFHEGINPGADIRVEKPESAIEIKKNYLKIANRTPNPEAAAKHMADLQFIGDQELHQKLYKTEQETLDIDQDELPY